MGLNTKERIYSSAMGIGTGDIVSTSYGTGPYEVWNVTKPRNIIESMGRVILPWPVISLVCTLPDETALNEHTGYYINEVHREAERYFSGGDEVFVEKRSAGYVAMSLFSPMEDELPTYLFQSGVDYACFDGELWHCRRCTLDYNALTVPVVAGMIPGDPRGRRPECPRCGGWPEPLYMIRSGEKWGSYSVMMHGRMIEQYKQFAPERIAYMYG